MFPLSCRLLLDFPVLSEDGKTEMSRAVSWRVSRPHREQVLRLQALSPRGEMRGDVPRPSVSNKLSPPPPPPPPLHPFELAERKRRKRKVLLCSFSARIFPQIFVSLEAVRHERRMREDESSEESVLRSGGWPGLETVQWIVRDSLPRWIRGRPRRKQRTFHSTNPATIPDRLHLIRSNSTRRERNGNGANVSSLFRFFRFQQRRRGKSIRRTLSRVETLNRQL